MTAADRPRVGEQITTAEQLDALWDLQDVLIEATGTYANGMGSFTACWARPVPSFVGGAVGTWEVLVAGDEVPANLTTTSKIIRATVLYVPGEPPRPPVTDNARAACGCDLSVGPNAVHLVDGHPDPRPPVTDDARAEGCEHSGDLAQLISDLDAGEASDGYHTHNELYEYRLLYNAHAAHGWHAAGIPVVKSWRHSDGEPCFGGGWFIVVATLPTGQVSNHYKAEHWGLFQVPEVDLPPAYDGHTPAIAANRLRGALAAVRAETTTEAIARSIAATSEMTGRDALELVKAVQALAEVDR